MLDKVNIHIIDGGHWSLNAEIFWYPQDLTFATIDSFKCESDLVLLHILQHTDIAEYKCDPWKYFQRKVNVLKYQHFSFQHCCGCKVVVMS